MLCRSSLWVHKMAVDPQVEKYRQLFGTVAAPSQQPVQRPVGSSWTGGLFGKGLTAEQYAGQAPATQKKNDGSWLDFLGPVKDIGMKAIEIADIPGAYLRSAVKELSDALYTSRVGEWLDWSSPEERARQVAAIGSGSWRDFLDQAKRHAGSQELFLSPKSGYFDMPGGWQRALTGMGLDIALDPLVYMSGGAIAGAKGAKAGAEAFTDSALRVAVDSGSSKLIGKRVANLAADAAERGVPGFERVGADFTNDAVNRFITDAYRRGRGALTPKGLERAGLDASMAAEFGIGKMQKTIAGVRIPGSTGVANTLEDLKGSIKAWGRDLGISQAARKTFTAEITGQRALYQILMDESVGLSKRAVAGVSLASSNNALKVGRAWGKTALDRARDTLKKSGWLKVSNEARVLSTHEIENGVVNELTDAARNEFKIIADEAANLGVKMGDLGPNYVPHQVRDEVFDAMRKNGELRDFYNKNLASTEGFQRVRRLREGQDFLGEPLKYGTIKEINDRFEQVFNMKLFEDDLGKIMPQYIAQVQQAVIREAQIDELARLGVVTDRGIEMIRKANDDPEFLKELADSKIKLSEAQAKTIYELSDGTRLRHDELQRLKPTLRAERDKVVARIAKIEQDLKELARKRFAADQAVKDAESQIRLLEDQVNEWTAVVKEQRGPARIEAQKKLNQFNKKLAAKRAERDRIVATIEGIMKGKEPLRFRTQRTRPLVAEEASLRADLQTMGETQQFLQSKVDELYAKVPVGQGGTPADRIVAGYTDRIDDLLTAKPKQVEELQAATQVYGFAEADSRSVLMYLNKLKDDLEEAYRIASKNAPSGKVKLTVKRARDEMRDRLNTVHAVLARTDNTIEERLVASVEAAAAVSDMRAWRSGNAEKQLMDALDVLSSKEFYDSEIVAKLGKNMVEIGERNQMPKWLFEATQIPFANQGLPAFGRWAKKFYNLFKGYAILRPGFHVRNAYSAMYNMYLEAGVGAFKTAKEFSDYYKLLRKTPDPVRLAEAAEKKFGAENARMLRDAWESAMGTGSGQIAGEFSATGLRRPSLNPLKEDFFLKKSGRIEGGLNPFSENNVLLNKSRATGEYVEDLVRGAHAYDVLKRGGSTDQAVDILNKWHFNYTDITSFDNAMKLVNPFWIFYSRNLALQATTFTRIAGRANRTLGNFQRNMEFGRPEDEYVPAYFKDAGAIRIGEDRYWFPDLPQQTAWLEFQHITNPSEWDKLLANTAPWFKGPIEIATDRNLYTGMSTENKFGQLFDPLGGPVYEQRYVNAIQGAIPGLGQTRRLFPSGDGGNAGQAWWSYLAGIGYRETNDRTRRGEIIRQQDEAYKKALLEAARREAGQ